MRRLIVSSLGRAGAAVLEADSLRGARRALSEAIDGVVLDRGLPEGDGLGLLAELAERHPADRVVVWSGVDMVSMRSWVSRAPRWFLSEVIDVLDIASEHTATIIV